MIHLPLMLDLFCGGGGATYGYWLAGFDVVGVDLHPQPSYPYNVAIVDAIDTLPNLVRRFRPDAIHASPPCQASSKTESFRRGKHRRNPTTVEPVNLIPTVRAALQATGLPYVIENVPHARTGLVDPVTLCGTMFGLWLYRHRWFEAGNSLTLTAPPHERHRWLCAPNSVMPTPERPMVTVTGRNGHHSKAWVRTAAEAMGTPWLATDLNATCEAIPPAYTRYIGEQVLAAL